MGLILPQTVEVKISVSNRKHYIEKGYGIVKFGDIITVNVLDLPYQSSVKVKVECDVCKKEIEKKYAQVTDLISKDNLIICNNQACINKKIERTCMKRYGVKSTNQTKAKKNKIKNTLQQNYGVDSPFLSQTIRNKAKQTTFDRYGVDNAAKSQQVIDKMLETNNKKYGGDAPMCSNEIKNKSVATCQLKYGCNNPMQNSKVKNKVKQTNRERYGCECVFQSEEIQKKAFKTLRSNGNTIHCSRQQTYLANLLNGEVNVPLTGYWVDIILKDKKIDLEYDGGGHTLCITRNQCTEEQFNQKEREREIKIYERGYKTIRIISKKDKLPSDEIILNLIKKFADFNFKVIRIDIDEGTIDIDYKEKLNYEFGTLREITDKDLK